MNHLSDSVSIIDAESLRVTRTLLVGDEPSDVVFGGAGQGRAFVTTAHRGQHRTHPSLAGVPGAGDPQLTTPGVGRADVWVFDADAPGGGPGGVPLRIVTLFGDTPRALAVSPDGATVYAAVLHSGNGTTTISEGLVCDGFDPGAGCTIEGTAVPGGNPGPGTNADGEQAPETGLIVKHDPASGEWRDELARDWSNAVRFDLPDLDVFAIDAQSLAVTSSFARVGTTLFNMAVDPVSGVVYVSNGEARNEVRFEGPGAFGGSTVQGHLSEFRITLLDGANVLPRHLNKHLDYDVLAGEPGFDASARRHSLATPLDMAVSSDGTTLYVAAFGSSKVGVLPTAALADDSFDPELLSSSYLDVSGGGPAGLALDEARGRLYVYTRFDDGISVVDLTAGSEVAHYRLHSPEPAHIVEGRAFLYDAQLSSANGEAACSSCHVFGDFDQLAWDLGNPDDEVTGNPIPIEIEFAGSFFPDINGTGNTRDFHPMKGPMTTQTLRGLATHGAMHWRGDRATGVFGQDAFDEELSFNNFIVAFEGLLGRGAPLPAEDMQKFTDFALEISMPPNPVRALDNSLTASQAAGLTFYNGPISDSVFNCNGCHTLDPANGFFGTDGRASFENESQILKIPQLRNAYRKVGMFGMADVPFVNGGDNGHKGDQIRGFGFLHDGSTDTLFRFFSATVFQINDTQKRQVEDLVLAFDTDLAPIVGQQVTLRADNAAEAGARIDLLEARAGTAFQSAVLGGNTTECDLVARGRVDDLSRGWLFEPAAGVWLPDRSGEPSVSSAALRALASTPGQELTFTCAPPGSGTRLARDRDLDGFLDQDERLAATEADNAASFPGACADGLDNDGDGLADLADPGCFDADWDIENPDCSNGAHDDADGLADFDGAGSGAPDPECVDRPFRKSEARNRRCGLGFEAALALLPLAWLGRGRGRAARGR